MNLFHNTNVYIFSQQTKQKQCKHSIFGREKLSMNKFVGVKWLSFGKGVQETRLNETRNMEKHAVQVILIFDAFRILYQDDFDISWELFRILNFWKMTKYNGENGFWAYYLFKKLLNVFNTKLVEVNHFNLLVFVCMWDFNWKLMNLFIFTSV